MKSSISGTTFEWSHTANGPMKLPDQARSRISQIWPDPESLRSGQIPNLPDKAGSRISQIPNLSDLARSRSSRQIPDPRPQILGLWPQIPHPRSSQSTNPWPPEAPFSCLCNFGSKVFFYCWKTKFLMIWMWAKQALWPDWAIYWTFGNFLKP